MHSVKIKYQHPTRPRLAVLPVARFKDSKDLWQYVGAMHKFLGDAFRGFVIVQRGEM